MDIIDLSTVATDDASFLDYIDQLCQKLGFDYASYATTSPMTGAVQGYANYPDSWKMHYMRRNLHRVDPTIHKSALSIAPVDWSRFERDERFRAVFFAAEDFGITPQGLTVPVRGPYGDRGLLSVTRNCARPEWEKHKRAVIGELQVAAVHLHDAVMRSDVISRACASRGSPRARSRSCNGRRRASRRRTSATSSASRTARSRCTCARRARSSAPSRRCRPWAVRSGWVWSIRGESAPPEGV